MKLFVTILTIATLTLLQAQSAYEKEFISTVNGLVKDGNITSISKVSCSHGDCFIKDLVIDEVDEESGKKDRLSVTKFTVEEIDNYYHFKNKNGALKEGEKRQFSFDLENILSNSHNLFFDKEEMAKELGEKSESFKYFKKYLDKPTNGAYTLKMQKKKGDVIMDDSGALDSGSFKIAFHNQYTVKGGFEKLNKTIETNPMGALAYVVINKIEVVINNPKGFLRNLMYIAYKADMSEAKSTQQKKSVNEEYFLEGDKLHDKVSFVKAIRKSAKVQFKERAKQDPAFNTLINHDKQLEKKVDAILAGTSKRIAITIDNPHSLSLGDLFAVVMGYTMQQKLAVKPDLAVTIK